MPVVAPLGLKGSSLGVLNMWILPEEQLKRNACVPVSVLGAENLVTCQSPHARPSLGTALDCSQWECWDEEGFCAKASCLGESGAVMGVLRDVWGGREGGMIWLRDGRIACLVSYSSGDKDHLTTSA